MRFVRLSLEVAAPEISPSEVRKAICAKVLLHYTGVKRSILAKQVVM